MHLSTVGCILIALTLYLGGIGATAAIGHARSRNHSSTNPVLLIQGTREQQQAEMNSTPPSGVRKRRRPAYSCVECRRRKVRCDRAKPCGQCTAHSAPSCTYAECHPRASQHADLLPEGVEQWHRTPERAAPPDDALPCTSTAPSRICGALNKTRVFGYGHWMNSMSIVR